jgi:hypothetical protein
MLIRFGPNQEVQRTPGQTDAAGRFLFTDLEIGPEFTYFVGVRYQERLHRSAPIILQSAEPAEVVLEVEAALAPPEGARGEQPRPRIINHLIVIVGRQAHLEVREVVRLAYAGTTPYPEGQAYTGEAGVSFHLPLPQGYYNFGQIQGLAAAHIRITASGLSYVAPLAPGEHRAVYTYSLPWHAGLNTILLERTLNTAVLDVLVEDERFIPTSDLQFGERVAITPHVFAHLRGVNLEAHSRSWLQLMPRQTSNFALPMLAYGLITGIALLGVVMPLRHSWQSREHTDKNAAESLGRQHLQDARRTGGQLLQSIARLDDQHADGRVEEAIYVQRRQAYKEQLLALVVQLQSAQVHQDA